MDAVAWALVAVASVATLVLAILAPRLRRDHLRRQMEGQGGSLSGVGAGFDAVWRPSAEEARADWEAAQEMPAPAPSPGDPGRIRDGSIVIDI